MKKMLRFCFVIMCSVVSISINAQNYCTTPASTFGDEGITQVRFDNQFTNNSTAPSGGYSNFTGQPNITATVQAGVSYSISVRHVGNNFFTDVYFDWDDNGTFEARAAICAGQNDGTYTINYTIPSNVCPGDYRMRFWTNWTQRPPASGCGADEPAGDNGEIEDYSITVEQTEFRTLNDVFPQQGSTAYVNKGNTDIEVLAFNVNVTSTGSPAPCPDPVILKTVNFNQSNSTDIDFDVLNTDLFYTGANPTFATGNRVGSRTDPKAVFSINNINNNLPELNAGDNWFWLAYDVSAAALPGHFLDAAIQSIIVDQNTLTNQTITVSGGDPAGTRQIIRYCIPGQNESGAYIDQVRLGDFESANPGRNTNGFITEYHSGSQFELCTNAPYELELDYVVDETAPGQDLVHAFAFFDWNDDGDYNDAKERTLIGSVAKPGSGIATGTLTTQVIPPSDAEAGEKSMRIAISDNLQMDACLGSTAGEMEEYAFTLESLGELTLDEAPAICSETTLNFEVANASGDFNLERSFDGSTWDVVPGSNNQNNISVSQEDTTAYYRLTGPNAACPNATAVSPIIDVPFVGIQYAFTDVEPICAGDSVTLSAIYGYKNQRFQSSGAQTFAAGELGEIAIDVSGVEETFNNRAVLDRIELVVNANDPASTTMQLVAPNGETLLLNSGNGNNTNQNYNFTPSANNSVFGAVNLAGSFLPEEDFTKLYGIDPNGTWTLRVYSEGGSVTVNQAVLSLGVNDDFVWSPSADVINPTSNVSKANPLQSTDFIATLDNKYCEGTDSLFTTVLGGLIPPEMIVTIDNANELQCDGRPVSFSADITGEFDVEPEIFWYVNGDEVPGEKSLSFTTSTLQDGDQVSAKFEANSFCGFFTDADTVGVTITPISFPELEVFSNDPFPVCINSTVTYQADTVNWFGITDINWFVNDDTAQVGGYSYSADTLQNADVVRVEAKGDYKCLSVPVKEDDILFRSIDTLRPNITLATNANGLVCLENTVELTADTAINNAGGYGRVDWYFDGKLTEALLFNAIDTFSTGNHTIRAEYVVTETTCAAPLKPTAEVSFEVSEEFIPAIDFQASDLDICDGDSVTFTITDVVDGGQTPLYQWFKNGSRITGATDTAYATNDIETQDAFSVRLQSSQECALFPFAHSEPQEVTVRQVNISELQISTETTDPVCDGERITSSITFVSGENAGQKYEWYVNNELVQNTPNLNFSSTELPDGAKVYAKMRSTLPCASPRVAVSDTLQYFVNPIPEPSFTFTTDTGGLRFTPNNMDYTRYQWEVDNGSQSNQISPYIQFLSNGTYEVCLTVIDANDCSNTICEEVEVAHVSTGGSTGIASLGDTPITVYPNPAQNQLYISGISSDAVEALYVQGLDGKQLQIPYAASGSDKLQLQVETLNAGMYIITLRTAQGDAQIKFHKR